MPGAESVPIGGFLKQSLIDYPGHISAVVFTCGCNFRCSYCHNARLIDINARAEEEGLNQQSVMDWIKANRHLLDAVVISGGEPCLHASLPAFIGQIKNMGLKVKLDSNGSNPAMLDQLIQARQLDYVAMDVKAPLNLMRYRQVVGNALSAPLFDKVLKSIGILMRKDVDYEFRTTMDKSLQMEDLLAIASAVSGRYFIQNRLEGGRQTGRLIAPSDVASLNKILDQEDVHISLR
ncbi:MAG: anaerobic ribonucleoside-triphosphate reductase activating protein [Bacteroidetes bacterium]|nr:MAG: anaerobic ribonucleoside-triphosphate reductase activating protein [Bacteroidota bacterium]